MNRSQYERLDQSDYFEYTKRQYDAIAFEASAWEARYMALLKAVADGTALQRPPQMLISDPSGLVAKMQKECETLLSALQQINDWCCYATEEDTSARLMALQQIGVHARAAIAAKEQQ